jgi:transcriptional regulator with XRE-family HTH domain
MRPGGLARNARPTVPTLPIPLLRDGLAREAARFSLRRVAREVGMSPNGLRDFLHGAAPRSASRVKLERWLAAQGQISRPPNVGQFVRLLNELAVDLSPKQTLELGRALAELLVESYEIRRLSPPRWVRDLVRRYESRPGKAASDVA